MYLIRTGLASCRPDASAREEPGILAGADALRHGSGRRWSRYEVCPIPDLQEDRQGSPQTPGPAVGGEDSGEGRYLSFAVIAAAVRGKGGTGLRIQKRPGKAPAFNRISRAD